MGVLGAVTRSRLAMQRPDVAVLREGSTPPPRQRRGYPTGGGTLSLARPAVVEKVRRMVSFLQDMEREDELWTVPSWKAHMLTGDRRHLESFRD